MDARTSSVNESGFNASGVNLGRNEKRSFAGAVLFLLLCLAVGMGLGDSLHSRLLLWGENLWSDYYALDPNLSAPTCATDVDVEREVEAQMLAGAGAGEDDVLGLFDDVELDEEEVRQSVLGALALCQQAHARYEAVQGRLTSEVLAYKGFEKWLAAVMLALIPAKKYLFLAVLMLCALVVTWKNEHIGLAPVQSARQRFASNLFQLLANLALASSFYSYWQNLTAVNANDPLIPLQLCWLAGFLALALMNGMRLFANGPSKGAQGVFDVLLAVPLYAWMVLTAFAYLMLVEKHPPGLAILLNQLTNLSNIFINIGLYVFVGMTLKHTRLPALCFDLLRPWQLAPAALAVMVIFATAWPTAFTGASGIFILAVGGVIYDEMRRAGSDRSLAMATTAMSGSLGVVLNPCLLVVVIAALNKEVITDQLFSWGFLVYLLSALLFSAVVLSLRSQSRLIGARSMSAIWVGMKEPLKQLAPYVLILVLVLLGFQLLLGVQANEHSAPLVLPVLLAALIGYEKVATKEGRRLARFAGVVADSSAESSTHIGALLMVIAASTCLGGIIDRSGLMMQLFPQELTSVWLVMLISLVLLVLIGMFMDPFGAVILVTATFAAPAMRAGVDPVHFWMVALVAFELGYLSPPVALNQLLTRFVVGAREWDLNRVERADRRTLFRRHEHVLMPIMVLFATLVIVAFGPLFLYGS